MSKKRKKKKVVKKKLAPKRPMLRWIFLKNFLSFGPPQGIELKPLNVLIGPNGSGKSNFIEAFHLLHNAPRDIAEGLRGKGGIEEWFWKGGSNRREALLGIHLEHPSGRVLRQLRYSISLRSQEHKVRLGHEHLGKASLPTCTNREDMRVHFESLGKEPPQGNFKDTYFFRSPDKLRLRKKGSQTWGSSYHVDSNKSTLSEFRNPKDFPELAWVADLFSQFRFYREIKLGPSSPPRSPQSAHLPNEFLNEDLRNLGHVLLNLRGDQGFSERFDKIFSDLVPEAQRVAPRLVDEYVVLHLEGSGFDLPASRLSDGTLRWIALLTILLHPTPPPLVCIEEPEIGLHPDVIHILADLLVEASSRMQLIVTTHSDILIDSLSYTPESVIVCEKEDGATRLQRLSEKKLKIWLKEYGLGNLWRSGQIGGNRW